VSSKLVYDKAAPMGWSPVNGMSSAGPGLGLRRESKRIGKQHSTSNTAVIEFYKTIGFAVDDVVSLGKRLVED